VLELNNISHLARLTPLKANTAGKGPLVRVANAPSHIIERDDGRYQIGLHDDAAGPFESRAFAKAVAARLGMAP
jgi:hypothetical protein